MDTQPHYRQLSLPNGTETLQLQEAARHRRITRALEDLFARWGYDPAETPMIDYFDVYRRLLAEDDAAQVYRAVDGHGEILGVRSDSTLFLARQLGLHLSDSDLPVRVFYNDQIVRTEDRHDISHNEFQQAGVELVGVSGVDGDAEALLMATEALSTLNLADAVIHIGSHAFIQACSDAFDIPIAALLSAVRSRRIGSRGDDGPGDGGDDGSVATIPADVAAVLRYIGPPSGLRPLWDGSALREIPPLRDALEYLVDLTETLNSSIDGDWPGRIRVDLSELGAYHYYSGIAFSAYLPWAQDAILRGGRYDDLLSSFGFAAPSVGFSIYTRKLPGDVLAATPESVPTVRATGDTFGTRVAAARRLHQAGQRSQIS